MRLLAIFGSAYIAAIFIFASIYTGMDHAFYDDKIKQEIPFRDETIDISKAIFEALQRPPCQKQATQQLPFCHTSERLVNIDSETDISVGTFNTSHIVTVGDGQLSLEGWFEAAVISKAKADTDNNDYEVRARIDFQQNDFFAQKTLAGYTFYGPLNDDELQFKPVVKAAVTFDRPINRKGNELALPPEELNKLYQYIAGHILIAHVISSDGNTYRLDLYTPDDLARRMDKLIAAASGYTSELNDNFSRMVYFSATTISTLGLGDIVPIRNPARWLVTAEAIVGAALLGLFLNALANSANRREN